MDNPTLARHLLNMAHDLEAKSVNFYRVKAYRRAAETIMGLDQPVEDVLSASGRKALRQLPGIGAKMSQKIESLVRTNDFATLTEGDDTKLVAR